MAYTKQTWTDGVTSANATTLSHIEDGVFAAAATADSASGLATTAVQPAGLTKAAVGLGSVDNTADTAKPVSTAQQTALDLKAPLANPTFTGTVGGLTKTMVGLGSVDNTADSAKPVSTAQQTALDLKAPLAGPVFTGTVGGITKTMVGLGNVDNTTDLNKPVSTATQTALDAKVDSLADLAVLLVALSAGAGMDMPIAYATAYALGSRPAAPTNWKFRIYGGLLADPDPAWMIAGDYRQIPAS